MIWIATIFMLIVFVHLLRQAMAEKRLYEEGVDDAAMAADEGLLASAIGYFRVDPGDGTASITGDNSRFGRAVAKVQSKTEGLGERFERKKDDILSRDDESTLFGRAVSKVSEKSEQLGQKLDARMDAARNQGADASGGIASEDTLMGRVAQRVTGMGEKFDAKIKEKAAGLKADGSTSMSGEGSFMDKMTRRVSRQLNSEEGGLMARVTGRVSGKLDTADEMIASKVRDSAGEDDFIGRTAAKMRQGEDQDDFIGRTASKIGPSIDAIDEKLIDKTRKSD